MSSLSPTPADLPRFPADRLLLWAAAALVLMPVLLFSSPEFRQVGFLAFGAVALALAGKIRAVREAAASRPLLGVVFCLLLIHVFSFIGGVRHGDMALPSGFQAIYGMVGVLGVAVLTAVLLKPEWRRVGAGVVLWLTVALAVGSLLGYFVFIGWHVEVGSRSVHYDPRRLSLVWPSRIPLMPIGQQFWSHANAAAYLFAAALVVLLDVLHRRPHFKAGGWILATALAVAVFLTASRSGLLMIAAALPFLLVFRPPVFALKTLGMLALAFGIGFAGLHYKIDRIAPPPAEGQTPPPQDVPGVIHVTGIVDRGSAGRLESYRVLWDDLAGARVFGQGFAANRLPFGSLMHEHSTFLATMRAGGLLAMAAHLAIAGIALWAGLVLALRGCRWPLLFTVAIFAGLLFDRSTVIRLTGFDEFLTHWFAVWIPILRLARSPGN